MRGSRTGDRSFQQVAERIEASILDGSSPDETRVPSTNALAAFHRINPATAGKGINQLVAAGTLYKKRGIGMFVATGAKERLRERRRAGGWADQAVLGCQRA